MNPPPFFSIFPKPSSYAEIHYKFKLPWSLLHQNWPEIFIDAPHQVLPNQECPLFLCIRDSHKYPVTIQRVTVDIRLLDHFSEQVTIPLNHYSQTFLECIPIPISLPNKPGEYHINARIDVQNKHSKAKTILNWNFRGIGAGTLYVKRLAEALPYPKGWSAGETHCHSWHSIDPVEYGAPIWAMQQVAKACGLGWVAITDHSYDFYYEQENYMKPANPAQRWQQYCSECAQLPADEPLMIPGEEISCGNHLGQNVHMIALNPQQHVAGLGDGGRRWMQNAPDLTIPQAVQAAGSQAFCYAAHPSTAIGLVEGIIFNRGKWWPEDLVHVQGMQFWNGSWDEGCQKGYQEWVKGLQTMLAHINNTSEPNAAIDIDSISNADSGLDSEPTLESESILDAKSVVDSDSISNADSGLGLGTEVDIDPISTSEPGLDSEARRDIDPISTSGPGLDSEKRLDPEPGLSPISKSGLGLGLGAYIPLGGNDAHGDFNQSTGVKIPLFSLKTSRNHVLGKVRTVIPFQPQGHAPRANQIQGVLQTLQSGVGFITDGPACYWESSGTHTMQFHAQSTVDFGQITQLRLHTIHQNGHTEITLWQPDAYSFTHSYTPTFSILCLWLECITSVGKRSITFPHFLYL
jgi:hypothetical protein